jgi:hypothetical protein
VLLLLSFALAATGCSRESPAPGPATPPPGVAQSGLTAASGDGPGTLNEALRGAAEIDAKRAAMRASSGTLAVGDTSATFEAFYEGVVLRTVEERTSHGRGGKAEKDYYLDDSGVLFYFHAEEERARTGQGESGTDQVRLRIVFDPAGNVRASEKTVNGQEQPLLDVDVQGVVARLGALRQAAEKGASSSK